MIKFKLSEYTKRSLEKSTGLSYNELVSNTIEQSMDKIRAKKKWYNRLINWIEWLMKKK